MHITSKSQFALIHALSPVVPRGYTVGSGVTGNASKDAVATTSLEAPTGPQRVQGGLAQEEGIINLLGHVARKLGDGNKGETGKHAVIADLAHQRYGSTVSKLSIICGMS